MFFIGTNTRERMSVSRISGWLCGSLYLMFWEKFELNVERVLS